ncbi:MAG TPA: 3-deoxy-8-phosphooctulonate synthase [Elusimicrobia bacterium]|jgi:2-dehydro-3-deoxyphosphooctonate aldolase (KDO 8-P synthase)|nr:3-deoxy-8-phosphooctulonate synthase [Elusimicrobiota bacterium]
MLKTKKIKIDYLTIGGNEPFILIAGPCVIDSEKMILSIVEKLKEITSRLRIGFIFKSSYDKANRSSIKSFRGVGLKEGLRILKKVKKIFAVPVLTDVHQISEVKPVAEVVDILQIPAFLCRQTDLLLAVGHTGKVVNIKKGQFLSPQEMKNVIEKVETTKNRKIILTERGSFFGYNNLVVDFRSLPILRSFGYPVIFDVTHSIQLPGGEGKSSGGESEFIEYLARAGVACGIDGIFLEVHPNPERALSDQMTMLKLEELFNLLTSLKAIDQLIKR